MRFLRPNRLSWICCAAIICLLLPAQLAHGQTYSVLYTFCSQQNCADGANPYAGLLLGQGGRLYGTTEGGGNSACFQGCGTAFEITSSGTFRLLYSFCSQPNCTDGANPEAGLIFGNEINAFGTGSTFLYGTTVWGGAFTSGVCSGGCGTVFQITPSGAEKVIYSFTGGSDGALPVAGVVRDPHGSLYGTALIAGGGGSCYVTGCGTVFKVSPDGVETTLYAFNNANGNPYGTLIRDAQGNLYGTASAVSENGVSPGDVFEVTSAGTYATLYAFTGGNDGGTPAAGVLRDANGNFYGTTAFDGKSHSGVVFKLTPSGKEHVLYTFCSQANCTDGGYPNDALIGDAQGNLYGTTNGGGAYGYGVVFKLSPKGQLAVLYSFTGGADGGYPDSGLALDGNGNLYGTTYSGGNFGCGAQYGCGVVFKITP